MCVKFYKNQNFRTREVSLSENDSELYLAITSFTYL